MKTVQKQVNNFINENVFLLKDGQLIKNNGWDLRITSLCQNTHFTYKILQYTCFNWTYYTCSYVKLILFVNSTNYAIFNMQDFRHRPFVSVLNCFGHVVHTVYCGCSPLNVCYDAWSHIPILALLSTLTTNGR